MENDLCLRCVLELARSESQEPPASAPLSVGSYRIVGRLGEGGMGVVYAAEQQHPYRRVALKVLRPTLLERHAGRFVNEYEILAFLDHPGIAKIYEAGVAAARYPNDIEVELPFFAMELIHGLPLMEYCSARNETHAGRLALFRQLVEAVHHAHQRGVIHRDIKPSNVLVGDRGQVKVVDFGVARATSLDHGATLATRAGEIIGTLPYMSPEQLAGRPGSVDTRSDIFALGVTFYELMAGRLPFPTSGSAGEAIAQRLTETTFPPPSRFNSRCRGDLDAIVTCCLQSDKEERYPSVAALLADLDRHERGEALSVRHASRLYVLGRRLKQYRTLVIQASIVLVALIAFAIVGWSLYRSASRANASAQLRLHESHLSRAEMAVASNRVSRRADALTAVANASDIRSSDSLTQLAVSAMSMDGLRLVFEIPEVTAVFNQVTRSERFLFPTSQGNDVTIYDGNSGRSLARVSGPPVSEYRWAANTLRPDGRVLAAKYIHRREGTEHIWVWDVPTGTVLTQVQARGDCPQFVGDTLLVALQGIHGYDVHSGTKLFSFAEDRRIRTHVVHPNKLQVALVVFDRVEIWDLNTHRLVDQVAVERQGELYQADVTNFFSAAWDPQGRRFAATTGSGRIHVWDLQERVLLHTLSKHDALAYSVLFGPGPHLLSAGWDRTARLWNLSTGTPAFDVFTTTLNPLATSDRRMALYGHGVVRVYEYVPSPERHTRYVGNAVFGLAYSPDGHRLAITGNSAIEILELQTNVRTRLLDASAREAVFAADGSRLWAGSRSGLYCWDVKGAPELVWSRNESVQGLALSPQQDSLLALVGNPLEGSKGHYMAPERWLGVFSPGTGALLRSLGERPDGVRPRYSGDGRYLSVSSWRGRAGVTERASGDTVRAFYDKNSVLDFSHAGDLYVEITTWRTAVFRTDTWEQLYEVDTEGFIPVCAFDPADRFLALAGPGMNAVRLVEAHTGASVVDLPLRQFDPTALTFSPDGRQIAVGTSSGMLITWNLDLVHERLRDMGIPSPFARLTAAPMQP